MLQIFRQHEPVPLEDTVSIAQMYHTYPDTYSIAYSITYTHFNNVHTLQPRAHTSTTCTHFNHVHTLQPRAHTSTTCTHFNHIHTLQSHTHTRSIMCIMEWIMESSNMRTNLLPLLKGSGGRVASQGNVTNIWMFVCGTMNYCYHW